MRAPFESQDVLTRQPVEEIKRKLLMWMLALAWLSTMPAWIMKESFGQSSAALRGVFALNAVFHPIVFFLSWKRYVSQRVIQFSCLLFAAVVCAGCMALSLYSPVYGATMDLEPLYLWIPMIYVFAFTLLDHRSSLRLSLAIMTLLCVVSLPYIVGPSHTHTVFTITLHTASAALIAALYFFSSYQHRFQVAQLTMDELARMANTDELTGLANRRRIMEVLESELRRSARYEHRFSIILLDVDHFKAINDRLGHDVGDQVLKALARRSPEFLREVDMMGRWGGEEFIVVLPETSFEESLEKASLLCFHVAATPLVGEHSISVSCGVTTIGVNDSLSAMFHRADAALYEAKRGGRNRAAGRRPDVAAESESESDREGADEPLIQSV